MFFKAIDKFFYQIKQFVSMVIFLLIALASFFFVYWLLFSAKVNMPEWLNTFAWAITDYFAGSLKGTAQYKELVPVLSVLTSGIFIILTYVCNCIMLFLENNHKKFVAGVENYKTNIEKQINHELHSDFLSELRKASYLLVKIKIIVNKHKSYLTAMTDDATSVEDFELKLHKQIMNSMNSNLIVKKGLTSGSVYFVIEDLKNSKLFFEELVSKATPIIKEALKPKLNISFYSGAELFNTSAEMQRTSFYIEKILSLKISNRIVAAPKFKIYYENLYPNDYIFSVVGEYNMSLIDGKIDNVMMHSFKRKN